MLLTTKFEKINWRGQLIYTGYIANASITEPRSKIDLDGRHQRGYKFSDVGCLWIYQATVHYFPEGLSNHLSNLSILKVQKCGLITLSRHDLSGFEKLEEMSFEESHLSSLPSNLFNGFHKLKRVSFARNRLTAMRPSILKPIMHNGVECIDLSNNVKIDCKFEKENGVSLQDLMKKIDECCDAPTEGFTVESFSYNFQKDLADMGTSKAFSDLDIKNWNGDLFKVHRNVLGIQSPVLARALSNAMLESTNGVLEVDDYHPEAVQQFFSYMYTGTIPSDLRISDLFALAYKYDVHHLK